MKEYITEIPITVNLETVSKYHSITKAKVGELKEKGQSASEYFQKLKVYAVKDESTNELHSAFDYWKYAQDVGISEKTADTLLYLIYVNCVYEWNVYYGSVITKDASREFSLLQEADINEMNFDVLARQAVEKIRTLCLYFENDPIKTVARFNLLSEIKKGKELRETYKADGENITEPALVKELLQTSINFLFNDAKNSVNPILTEALKNIERPTYNSLTESLEFLPVPPKNIDDALSDFRKFLIDLCLQFFNKEAGVDIDKKSIPISFALLIYSLFACFKLINPKTINNHTKEDRRKNYIQLMAYNPGNVNKTKQRKQIKELKEGTQTHQSQTTEEKDIRKPYSFKDIEFISE